MLTRDECIAAEKAALRWPKGLDKNFWYFDAPNGVEYISGHEDERTDPEMLESHCDRMNYG